MATQNQTEAIDEKWDYYKQRENVPIWTAVALTLDLDPRQGEIAMKEALTPELSAEYKKRRMIAVSRYGTTDGLTPTEHHAARGTPAGKYVALKAMLVFAQAMNWHQSGNLAPMQKALGPQVAEPAVMKNDAYQIPENDYGKGSRYRAIRMGALLDLINQWISADGKISGKLVIGKAVNVDALATELEAQIERKAQVNGWKGKVPAQGNDGIRKQLGDDQKAFAEVGKTKKSNRGK